jgi:PPOX class probable F420-dependent enzyme
VSDDGNRLLVWAGARTWKVRRVLRNPRVLVAPSTFRGAERGERIVGKASVIPDPGVDDLLRRKYGWQKLVVDRLNRRNEPTSGFATIEIVDAD